MVKNTSQTDNIILRPITYSDNSEMETIIRTVLTEFDANRPGFAWQDPELSNLTAAYERPDTAYWIAEVNGKVVGGCGIGQLASASLSSVGELQKMYVTGDARGLGIGQQLISVALAFAQDHYGWCYLETLHTMTKAERLYRASGFIRLPAPLLQTEHNACDRWFLKELQH
ncbi:GNAT family N-acetyltransferase [Reinekea sp. G2M2-21]|uniref:GNAT family N-acetyltransferase n=1 Tax=Reinekea sp. G2M2-21 TaxID=2788942 RepID=UPI0018AA9743|nr:GNAT family N-acetyltransferase [Reinekea sp. G2M2-21]